MVTIQGMPSSTRRTRNGHRTVRVVIADNHRMFADALRTALRRERGIAVTAVVDDAAGAVKVVREKSPDIVLLAAQGLDAAATIRQIRESDPHTRVVVVVHGPEDDPAVARALEAGATGLLPRHRPVRDVAASIRAAARGEELLEPEEARRLLAVLRRRRYRDATDRERVARLTRRETEILQAMADGLPPGMIAGQLGISPHTLRTHVQNILFKLRVHSKLEAVALALRYGKVTLTEPNV